MLFSLRFTWAVLRAASPLICVSRGQQWCSFISSVTCDQKASHLLYLGRVRNGCLCCTNRQTSTNVSCFFLCPTAQTPGVRMKKAIGVLHLMLVLLFSPSVGGTGKPFSAKPSVSFAIQLVQVFWFLPHVERPQSSGEAHTDTMSFPWKRDVHLLVGTGLRWRLAHHLCLVLPQREVSDHEFGAAVNFLQFRQFDWLIWMAAHSAK